MFNFITPETAAVWFQAFAAAFLPLFAAFVTTWLSQKDKREKWQIAVARAAGTAYTEAVKSGKPLSDPTVLAQASAAGVAYLFDLNPQGAAALKAPGLQPVEIATKIVGAELGKLLAADPTVKVAP